MDHSRNAVSERRAPNPPGTIEAPLCVGSLDAEGDRIIGLISISTGALLPTVQMMIGERFKVIAMGGNRLKHRRALLLRIWLEMTMDEDDTPATETAAPSSVAERAIAGEREARRRRIAISGVPPYCRVRRTASCLRR